MRTLEEVGTRLHRRHFLMGAGAAVGSAILAACGGSTATDTPKAPALTTAPTTAAPTSAAAAATRPAGSVAASAIATTAPAASTTASSTTAIGSAAVATRPAGSAVASSVSATTASGSAVAGTTGSGGIQTMVIEAFDFGYKTLGSIPGGQTRVQMKNTGKEIHHGQFMLLNTGVTPDQLGAAFAKGEQGLGEVFGLVTQAGGPGVTLPGSSTEVILNLTEGQYLIACFIAGADHIPHLAKGMLMPLKVTAAPAAAAAPAVNGTITMFDFNFTMPDTLPAGKSMYTVMNTGVQFHEFNIGQIPPGKTVDDVKAYYAATTAPAGPPPLIPMGGMNALTKGNTGIAVFDLTPGNYVAICNVPDQSKPNGDSHAHLGMIKGFIVK